MLITVRNMGGEKVNLRLIHQQKQNYYYPLNIAKKLKVLRKYLKTKNGKKKKSKKKKLMK